MELSVELLNPEQMKECVAEDVEKCCDVVQVVEPTESVILFNEHRVKSVIAEMLTSVYGTIAQLLETDGYKSYIAEHDRYGREVVYYVKGNVVIVVDYHETNTLIIDVLPEEEAADFIQAVKKEFGESELS